MAAHKINTNNLNLNTLIPGKSIALPGTRRSSSRPACACWVLSTVWRGAAGAMTIRMLLGREVFPSLLPLSNLEGGRGDSSSRAQGLRLLSLSVERGAHYAAQYMRAGFQRRSSPTSLLKQWGLGKMSASSLGRRSLISLQALETSKDGC